MINHYSNWKVTARLCYFMLYIFKVSRQVPFRCERHPIMTTLHTKTQILIALSYLFLFFNLIFQFYLPEKIVSGKLLKTINLSTVSFIGWRGRKKDSIKRDKGCSTRSTCNARSPSPNTVLQLNVCLSSCLQGKGNMSY